nr:hypothetical protein GTC16762_31720 [Pigmentibacter ruber]
MDESFGYQGIGAYTGCVLHKNGRTSYSSTIRTTIPRDNYYFISDMYREYKISRGERWNPKKRKNYPDNLPWGILSIKNLNDKDYLIEGMASVVYSDGNIETDIVGYTHGMVQGIYISLAQGNESKPYEIAVGKKTTKLASCLGCSLFMHANGYPPSSMHLGSSASWAPMYPYHKIGKNYLESKEVEYAIHNANLKWDRFCKRALKTGRDILYRAKSLNKVNTEYYTSLNLFNLFFESNKYESYMASNLILDAFTIQKQARNHILETLK